MTQTELTELIQRKTAEGGPPALDIGCGLTRAEPGAIGVDWSEESGAEVICDLDRYPWPLPADSFGRIHMSHIIEHVEDPMRAMKEVHRVARGGAGVFITTPHFSSHNSYTDPTHRRHLSAASFEYFTERKFATFAGAHCGFEIMEVKLTFGGNFVLDGLGRWIANCSLRWYERHCAWIFPALDIRAHLRVVK